MGVPDSTIAALLGDGQRAVTARHLLKRLIGFQRGSQLFWVNTSRPSSRSKNFDLYKWGLSGLQASLPYILTPPQNWLCAGLPEDISFNEYFLRRNMAH